MPSTFRSYAEMIAEGDNVSTAVLRARGENTEDTGRYGRHLREVVDHIRALPADEQRSAALRR